MTVYKKLLEVQKIVGAVEKKATNPFFNSAYFDINQLIEVVNPVLTTNNLVLTQPIIANEDGSMTVTSVLTDVESGEQVKSSIPFPVNSDPQKLGSAISYFRRYSLQSLLGLRAIDDDSNKAAGKETKKKAAPRKSAGASF